MRVCDTLFKVPIIGQRECVFFGHVWTQFESRGSIFMDYFSIERHMDLMNAIFDGDYEDYSGKVRDQILAADKLMRVKRDEYSRKVKPKVTQLLMKALTYEFKILGSNMIEINVRVSNPMS